VAPLRAGERQLAEQYRNILTSTAGLDLLPATEQIADRAAALRAEYGLRVADALIASTAVGGGSTHFIANDAKFAQVAGLRTLVVSDYLD